VSRTLAWLLGAAHLSTLDVDGRPLGEAASPEYARCPRHEARRRFDDVRDTHDLPVNLAALAQLKQTWPTLLETLASWEADAPATHGRALRRIDRATSRPLFRRLRGAPIRRIDAALFKVCLGFGELLRAMLLEERADADAPPVDAATLTGWLDERPWLVGDTQVCAGTRAQIESVWAALSTSGPDARPADPATEALRTVHAIAAAAASTSTADDSSLASALARAAEVPRICEAVRQAGVTPVHVSLLFESQRVPPALRDFLEALPRCLESDEPREAIDAALLDTARAPVAALFATLGLAPERVTDASFRDATRS